jgi:hypothetical protein
MIEICIVSYLLLFVACIWIEEWAIIEYEKYYDQKDNVGDFSPYSETKHKRGEILHNSISQNVGFESAKKFQVV